MGLLALLAFSLSGLTHAATLFNTTSDTADAPDTSVVETDKAPLDLLQDPVTVTILSLPYDGTLAIDGQMEAQWDEYAPLDLLHVVRGSPAETGDISATWQATWDSNAFYLFVNVFDDTHVTDSPSNFAWEDDSVEVYLYTGSFNANANYAQAGTYQLIFRSIKGKKAPEITSFTTEKLPEMLAATEVRTDGYTLEIALPWTSIGVDNVREGMELGIDVQVNDDDDFGTRDSKLTWADAIDDAFNTPLAIGRGILALTNITDWQGQGGNEGAGGGDAGGGDSDSPEPEPEVPAQDGGDDGSSAGGDDDGGVDAQGGEGDDGGAGSVETEDPGGSEGDDREGVSDDDNDPSGGNSELPGALNPMWPHDAAASGDGWYNSAWFGQFWAADAADQWIFHAEHGWLYMTETGSTAVTCFTFDMGWIYTSPEMYPFIFRFEDSLWLYYAIGSGLRGDRLFYNDAPCVETWESFGKSGG